MAFSRTAYLLAYNVGMAAGWSYALYLGVKGALDSEFPSSLAGCMPSGGSIVGLFQMISLLEVFHALFGLVRGSPLAALLQWTGRSNVLFNVILPIPTIYAAAPAGAMMLAWCLSEIIRYPWYAAQIKGTCPFWLTWLRYSAFIPLYPVGVVGEMLSIYNALPTIQANLMHSVQLPNSWNFGFDYATFMKIVLVLYPGLWWMLYSGLLKTRAKKLPKL